MLMLFSQYLIARNKKLEKLKLSELKAIAEIWFDAILDDGLKLANYYASHSEIWKNLGIKRREEEGPFFAEKNRQSPWEKYFDEVCNQGSPSESEFIQSMDNYFYFVMSKINNFLEEGFTYAPPIDGQHFFPFRPEQSGVEMVCRIRDGSGKVVFETEASHSWIGASNTEQKNIKKHMVDAQKKGGLPYLDDALQKISGKKFLALADTNSPHAEDDFYIMSGNKLFEFIDKIQLDLNNDFASDSCSVSLLVGSRLEFIMTTSPCGECQHYFRALRVLLNEKNLSIPILIFAKAPYNTSESVFSIFSVDAQANYCALSFKWNMTMLHERKDISHVEDIDSFNPEYRTVLALNIFGEALLPRLMANPILVPSFFESLLESSVFGNSFITSHFFLDWLKFYFVQVMTGFPYDLNGTSLMSLTSPEAYPNVQLNFLRAEFFRTSRFKKISSVVRHAQQGDNALLFFLRVFPKWGEMLYSRLKTQESPELSAVSFDSTDKILEKIYKHLFWNPDTAPENLPEEVSEFSSLVRIIGQTIHYAIVAPEFRRNLLNSTLTHPGVSPLGAQNYRQSDEQMGVTVYSMEQAISDLCYDPIKKRWRIHKLESIHQGFRNQEIIDELAQQMKKQSHENKRVDTSFKRIFPQGQAFDGYAGIQRKMAIVKDGEYEGDAGHPDYQGHPKMGYAVEADWGPFLQYLEGDFAAKINKGEYKLSFILLTSEQLLLEFRHPLGNRRLTETLQNERECVYKAFNEHLTALTGRISFEIESNGGFNALIMGSSDFIYTCAQHLSGLSFFVGKEEVKEHSAESYGSFWAPEKPVSPVEKHASSPAFEKK